MKYLNYHREDNGNINIYVEHNGTIFRRITYPGNPLVGWARDWDVPGVGWNLPMMVNDPEDFSRLESLFWALGTQPKPETAAPPVQAAIKTVKVRVAVAVLEDGDWGAKGGCGLSDEYVISGAAGFAGNTVSRLYWLTAELPVPQSIEIPADVQQS